MNVNNLCMEKENGTLKCNQKQRCPEMDQENKGAQEKGRACVRLEKRQM